MTKANQKTIDALEGGFSVFGFRFQFKAFGFTIAGTPSAAEQLATLTNAATITSDSQNLLQNFIKNPSMHQDTFEKKIAAPILAHFDIQDPGLKTMLNNPQIKQTLITAMMEDLKTLSGKEVNPDLVKKALLATDSHLNQTLNSLKTTIQQNPEAKIDELINIIAPPPPVTPPATSTDAGFVISAGQPLVQHSSTLTQQPAAPSQAQPTPEPSRPNGP